MLWWCVQPAVLSAGVGLMGRLYPSHVGEVVFVHPGTPALLQSRVLS